MHPKHFIAKLDEAKIVEAIKQAEESTSGEIRVSVSRRNHVDALSAAQKRFFAFGMNRTPERNAVLIYFAPRTHTFAIWGDIGVHEKCGNCFWQDAAAKISGHLKAGQLTQAVEVAVQDVGKALAQHFPCTTNGENRSPKSP